MHRQTPRDQLGRVQTWGWRVGAAALDQVAPALFSQQLCVQSGAQAGGREAQGWCGNMPELERVPGQGCNRERLTLKLLQVARPHPGGSSCSPRPSWHAAGAQCPSSAGLRSSASQRPAPPGPQRLWPCAPRAAELGCEVSARMVAAAASGRRRALLWAPQLRGTRWLPPCPPSNHLIVLSGDRSRKDPCSGASLMCHFLAII